MLLLPGTTILEARVAPQAAYGPHCGTARGRAPLSRRSHRLRATEGNTVIDPLLLQNIRGRARE